MIIPIYKNSMFPDKATPSFPALAWEITRRGGAGRPTACRATRLRKWSKWSGDNPVDKWIISG